MKDNGGQRRKQGLPRKVEPKQSVKDSQDTPPPWGPNSPLPEYSQPFTSCPPPRSLGAAKQAAEEALWLLLLLLLDDAGRYLLGSCRRGGRLGGLGLHLPASA